MKFVVGLLVGECLLETEDVWVLGSVRALTDFRPNELVAALVGPFALAEELIEGVFEDTLNDGEFVKLDESCRCELRGLGRDGMAERVLPASVIMPGFPRLRLRVLLFALSSRRLAIEELPCPPRGNGESRSTTLCDTGAGLALATGMRDTDGLGKLLL